MLRSNRPAVETAFQSLGIAGLLTVLMLTGGCDSNQSTPEQIQPEPVKVEAEAYVSPFREVMSPVNLHFMSINPLNERYKEDTVASNDREIKLTVSGLQDKEIEAEINEQIQKLHQNVKEDDLPPYRGIRRIITEDHTVRDQYMQTLLSFNYNNIISVVTTSSRTYSADGPDGSHSVDYIDVLNLDLNTGEEIRLSDLFVNDVDYRDVLNARIHYYLEKEFASDENFGYPELVAPFKGIKDNQKYMLSENAIQLIIDHETPEFDNSFYCSYISIPFNDVKHILAIGERFNSDGDLYIDNKPPKKILISHYFKYMTGERSQQTVGTVDVYSNYQYPPDLSSVLQERFEEFRKLDDEEIQRLNTSSTKAHYYQESYASLIGKYTIFTKSRSSSQGDKVTFVTAYEIYNKNNELISLKDIFTDQYDYEGFLKNKISEAAPDNMNLNEGEINRLYEELTFRLNTSGMYFSTVPVSYTENETHPISFPVEYDQLGYENLKIFE